MARNSPGSPASILIHKAGRNVKSRSKDLVHIRNEAPVEDLQSLAEWALARSRPAEQEPEQTWNKDVPVRPVPPVPPLVGGTVEQGGPSHGKDLNGCERCSLLSDHNVLVLACGECGWVDPRLREESHGPTM